jgi:hypothetical protein
MVFRWLMMLLLSAVGAAPISQAQDYDQYTRQLADAAHRTWRIVIKPKFLDAMSDREKAIVDEIDFRFPPERGMDAFATEVDGEKIVLVSGGFVAFQEEMISAVVFALKFGLVNRLDEYFRYAAQEALRNAALIRSGQTPRPVPTFNIYAHIPLDRAMQFWQSNEFASAMLNMRIGSLAYVLGHEIGHHVNHDYKKVTVEKQRERELKADMYAIQIMTKAGLWPVYGMAIMWFFSEAGDDSTHPPASCRMANFWRLGVPALLADAGFQKYLDANPELRRRFENDKSGLERIEPEIEHDCGQWLLRAP